MIRRVRPHITFAVFILLSIPLCACDGLIRLDGRVYTQRGRNAESRAYIDQVPNDDLTGLIPVEGASVTLYYGQISANQPTNDSTLTSSQVTDAAGRFDLGGVCAPTEFDATLVVEKAGYKPVRATFRHKELKHGAIVILVANDGTESPPRSKEQPN